MYLVISYALTEGFIMGCDGCKSKDSCSEKQEVSTRNPNIREDISQYLKPKKKPRVDNTSLNMSCNCDGHEFNPKVPRWQCKKCIASWVRSISREEALESADDFEKNGKKIVAERIRDAIKEIDYLKPVE